MIAVVHTNIVVQSAMGLERGRRIERSFRKIQLFWHFISLVLWRWTGGRWRTTNTYTHLIYIYRIIGYVMVCTLYLPHCVRQRCTFNTYLSWVIFSEIYILFAMIRFVN